MRHFYHLCCAFPWERIARSHVEALRVAGAAWEVTVGLAGPAAARAEARSWFEAQLPGASLTEAGAGFEQVTLRELHAWARRADPQEPVLYAHAKGITYRHHDGLYGTVWRESMTSRLVGGWERCMDLLEGHDAVGCHWLTPELYPGLVSVPYFAGNFWWARAGYVAGLPPVSDESRFHAEGWIGLNAPRVHDLRPGWPTLGLFSPDLVVALNPSLAGR